MALCCWLHETLQRQSASFSLAPVSHRWVGLLIRGTLLHQIGPFKCCAEQKYNEKCAGGTQGPQQARADLFFFFFFTFASRNAVCSQAEEAAFQKYIWLIGRLTSGDQQRDQQREHAGQ